MEYPGVLEQIAERRNMSAAQVALAWAMQLGYAVIPSSTKRAHLESNFAAQQFMLSTEDMEASVYSISSFSAFLSMVVQFFCSC